MMRKRKSYYGFVFSCILIVGFYGSRSFATDSPETFTLNPETIRHQVLENNISVIEALSQVHDAKDQVNVARGNLLPSLNVGAVFSLASGSFALSTIQFLVPFLLPSNWYDLSQQIDLFNAEILSFQIMELNTYSSALSIYYTVVGDEAFREVYLQKAKDLEQIQLLLQDQYDFARNVPQEDVLHAKSQAETAQVQASQMSELAIQELAALRKALGLPLSTVFQIEPSTMAVSASESQPLDQTLTEVMKTAPESKQIQALVEASQNAGWSKAFSFINSFSIGAQSSGSSGGSAAFSNLKTSGSLNLGFAYFPGMSLSKRNTKEVQMRATELVEEYSRVLESSIKSIAEATRQVELATSAESELSKVYLTTQDKYSLGIETLLNVLQTRTQFSDASIARIKAETDLNLLRVTLHRALLTDQFSKIEGCQINPVRKPKRDFWTLIGRLFKDPTPSHAKIDQICQAATVI